MSSDAILKEYLSLVVTEDDPKAVYAAAAKIAQEIIKRMPEVHLHDKAYRILALLTSGEAYDPELMDVMGSLVQYHAMLHLRRDKQAMGIALAIVNLSDITMRKASIETALQEMAMWINIEHGFAPHADEGARVVITMLDGLL